MLRVNHQWVLYVALLGVVLCSEFSRLAAASAPSRASAWVNAYPRAADHSLAERATSFAMC